MPDNIQQLVPNGVTCYAIIRRITMVAAGFKLFKVKSQQLTLEANEVCTDNIQQLRPQRGHLLIAPGFIRVQKIKRPPNFGVCF